LFCPTLHSCKEPAWRPQYGCRAGSVFSLLAASFQSQALFGAGGGAQAAADAGRGVQLPALGGAVHRDGALGAFSGAERAVNALAGVVLRLAAGLACRRGVRRFGPGEGLAGLLRGGLGVARHDGPGGTFWGRH